LAGTFATWQPEYAARGLATFPLRSDDRKRPAVGNYNRMGMNASRQLAMKWGDAEGLACMAGSRNKLTIIDIDARGAEGERLLADVQREAGEARFIVRTGGGGFHAYYRHNGEGRKIRLDPRRPIDLLGGGQIVLPPSRGSKAQYEIIRGTLDDLTALTPIRTAAKAIPTAIEDKQQRAPLAAMQANSGRNNTLFDILRKEARRLPQTLEAFIDRARQVNQTFGEPMIDSRVVNTAKSVFRYVETGELRTGDHGAWFQRPHVQSLVREPHLFALIGWLKAENGPDSEFWIANGLAAAHLGWPIDQLREARTRAIQLGWIEIIAQPAKGRNALYRWGPTARTSQG
jgi:Bifunctional DNA primase/polymerase, N-terminal/Primase C terminal 1 (PriCT-1)